MADLFERIGERIPNVGIKRVSGEALRGARDAVVTGARLTWEAYDWSARMAYRAGRFNSFLPLTHVSRSPEIYNKVEVPLLFDIPGGRDIPLINRIPGAEKVPSPLDLVVDKRDIYISLPFKYDGETVRASKTTKIEACRKGTYPRLIMNVKDVHPDMSGDETILIYTEGIDDISGEDVISYMYWQPRMIVFKQGDHQYVKYQADSTAWDIAQELCKNVRDATDDRIDLHPKDALQGLKMATYYSKDLRERWKILEAHLKFSKYMTTHGDVIKGGILEMLDWTMLTDVPPELTDVFTEMDEGKIQTFFQLRDALNRVRNQNLIGHGAALAEYMGMQTTLYKDTRIIRHVPLGIILSARGVQYFNNYLDARVPGIEKEIQELAKDRAEVGRRRIVVYRKFAQLEQATLSAAIAEIENRIPEAAEAGRRVAEAYTKRWIETINEAYIDSGDPASPVTVKVIPPGEGKKENPDVRSLLPGRSPRDHEE